MPLRPAALIDVGGVAGRCLGVSAAHRTDNAIPAGGLQPFAGSYSIGTSSEAMLFPVMDWGDVFLGDATSALRVVVITIAAYGALVMILRVTGKRTLSKMNAFDLVVTVALGSTLATVILSKSVSLLQGVLAFTMLALLQFAVTWLSVRSGRFERWIKAEPRLLAHRGTFLDRALKDERVTREEVEAALRDQGVGSLSEAVAVVLETNGQISVVKSAGNKDALPDR